MPVLWLVTSLVAFQLPFARYVAHNSILNLKRYSIERVYRQLRAQSLHPREVIECAFDIVTTAKNSVVPDAELLTVVEQVINQFPVLQVGFGWLSSGFLSHVSTVHDQFPVLQVGFGKLSNGSLSHVSTVPDQFPVPQRGFGKLSCGSLSHVSTVHDQFPVPQVGFGKLSNGSLSHVSTAHDQFPVPQMGFGRLSSGSLSHVSTAHNQVPVPQVGFSRLSNRSFLRQCNTWPARLKYCTTTKGDKCFQTLWFWDTADFVLLKKNCMVSHRCQLDFSFDDNQSFQQDQRWSFFCVCVFVCVCFFVFFCSCSMEHVW